MIDDFAIQIVTVAQDPVLMPDATLQRRVRVDYKIGSHGPFSATFPQEEFSAVKANQVMQAMKAEIQKLGR